MGSRYVECMPYTAPRHLQAHAMPPQYGPPGAMPFPPHGLPPIPGPPGHQGQRGMRPVGPYGAPPPHMAGYGGQPPPPPPQGGQVMPPGPAVIRAPGGGRGSQVFLRFLQCVARLPSYASCDACNAETYIHHGGLFICNVYCSVPLRNHVPCTCTFLQVDSLR
jgi:hypothetical protein